MTALAVAAAVAVPPSFVFGREGGNIVPLRAQIEHGSCNRRFDRVYAALAKAVGEP